MTEHLYRPDARLASLDCGREDLSGALTAVLFRHDPIQIAYATNADEYRPEAAHILTRLNSCRNPAEVCLAIHEELVRSFGAEAVGAAEGYSQIAHETWALWQSRGQAA